MLNVAETTNAQTTLPTHLGEVGPVTPTGGWAVMPDGDDLVAVAAALNATGQPPVFLDHLTA